LKNWTKLLGLTRNPVIAVSILQNHEYWCRV